MIHGKPQVIINQRQNQPDGEYYNSTLKKLTAEELLELTNNFNSGQDDNNIIIQKILNKLSQNKEKLNEYERTTVHDQTLLIRAKMDKNDNDLN